MKHDKKYVTVDPEYITVSRAAEMLGITAQAVYGMIREKKLKLYNYFGESGMRLRKSEVITLKEWREGAPWKGDANGRG